MVCYGHTHTKLLAHTVRSYAYEYMYLVCEAIHVIDIKKLVLSFIILNKNCYSQGNAEAAHIKTLFAPQNQKNPSNIFTHLSLGMENQYSGRFFLL